MRTGETAGKEMESLTRRKKSEEKMRAEGEKSKGDAEKRIR